MASLLNKTADTLHKHHGFYVSDGFIDAAVGTYGIKDGDTLEPMGTLKAFNQGIPDPKTSTTAREPRWFKDEGVSVGRWQVGAGVPGGLAQVSVKIDFANRYGMACFLSAHDEVRMTNTETIGNALASLYREKGNAWKLSRKWVTTALKVQGGFIVMGMDQGTSVTVSGSAVVSAEGVPLQLDVAGLQFKRQGAVEFVSLGGISPFLKLAEVYDPLFQRADWRAMN